MTEVLPIPVLDSRSILTSLLVEDLQPSPGTEELPELTLREHPTPTPADTSECHLVHNAGALPAAAVGDRSSPATQTSPVHVWWEPPSPSFYVQPAAVQRRPGFPLQSLQFMSAIQVLSDSAWWDLPLAVLGFMLAPLNCVPLVPAMGDPPHVPVEDPPHRGVQYPVIGDTSPSVLLGPQSIAPIVPVGPEHLSPQFPDHLVSSVTCYARSPVITVGPELSVLITLISPSSV